VGCKCAGSVLSVARAAPGQSESCWIFSPGPHPLSFETDLGLILLIEFFSDGGDLTVQLQDGSLTERVRDDLETSWRLTQLSCVVWSCDSLATVDRVVDSFREGCRLVAPWKFASVLQQISPLTETGLSWLVVADSRSGMPGGA
jgi:hypothetical protein